MLLPRDNEKNIKIVAAVSTLISLILSVWVWLAYDRSLGGIQFVEQIPWYTMIAWAVSKGQAFLSPKIYQALLISCGVFMLGLGVYFVHSGLR
jgi:threonine/homoserine/homoserine lactone efflux protein